MVVLGQKDKSPTIQDFHRCKNCGYGSFMEVYGVDPETRTIWKEWKCPYCGHIQKK